MLLTDARNRLRVDLSDVDEELLTEDVLDRSVQRAVSDLSRFLPRDRIYEITLVLEVAAEPWTSAAAPGTYVELDSKPIKLDSEDVKNLAGADCVRDTDYYMDYTTGRTTHISGGQIGNAEACTISYSKSDIIVDISSITSDLVRIERLEYPVGNIPQEFVPFGVFEDLLSVRAGAMETQASMNEKDHLVVYYKSKHTGPTIDEEGTYPNFLDDTVILAASAYALFSSGIKYVNLALTDLASARTALGSIAAIHTKASAALDSAKDSLEAAILALAAANVDDFLSGAAAPSVKKFLTDGVAFVNVVTKGVSVAERYAIYAQRSSEIALSFIQKASALNSNASGYSVEAGNIISEIDRYIGEADRYVNLATQNLSIADKIRIEAIERRNEAWAIWRDAPQFSPMYSISSAKQISKG